MKVLWLTLKNIPHLYLQFRSELKQQKKQLKDIEKHGNLEVMLRHFEEAIETDMPHEIIRLYLTELVGVYQGLEYDTKDIKHESALKKYCSDYNVKYTRRDG